MTRTRSRTALGAALWIAALACGPSEEAGPPATAGVAAEDAAAPAAPPPDAPPAPPAPAQVGEQDPVELRFGLGVAADGGVTTPVTSFARGDRVCVAVTAAAASPGASVALRWLDSRGEAVGEASAALAGAPPRAGLCLPGSTVLTDGTYSLDVELDGRELGSAQFAIGELRELAGSGGT